MKKISSNDLLNKFCAKIGASSSSELYFDERVRFIRIFNRLDKNGKVILSASPSRFGLNTSTDSIIKSLKGYSERLNSMELISLLSFHSDPEDVDMDVVSIALAMGLIDLSPSIEEMELTRFKRLLA